MALRGGRYEIIRMIASGGMATVHLGRVLGVGGFERLVAVKVMHPHVAAEPECVDMFLDEARLAARIRHPNVVGTIDVSEDEDGVFLVMEYVEGPSLHTLQRALKKKQAELPIDVALRVFLDTLAGLHAAHELNDANGAPLHLVHRDVSPHNILIGVDGIARITDFGVAHAETRLSTTKGGQVKGKFAYMSPEQVRSMPIDRRSDVYAAGVVLWEALTGQRMLRNDNDLAMITQILGRAWKLPHELTPSVPKPVSDACARALSLEPGDRFATAAAFAEAIEEAARASGVTIASARGVSQFIKEMNAHDSPGELPGPMAGPVSGRSLPPSVPPPSMRSGPRSVKTPVPGGVYDAVMTPGALASAEPVPISTQKRAVVTSTTEVAPVKERRSGSRAFVLVAALVVGGGVGWLALSKGGDEAPQGMTGDRGASAAAGTSVGAHEPPKSAPSAPAVRDEPGAAPSSSGAPAGGVAGGADAGSDASAPFPAPPFAGRPAGKPSGSPASPPVFRPREL